jgi:hypothetical protein
MNSSNIFVECQSNFIRIKTYIVGAIKDVVENELKLDELDNDWEVIGNAVKALCPVDMFINSFNHIHDQLKTSLLSSDPYCKDSPYGTFELYCSSKLLNLSRRERKVMVAVKSLMEWAVTRIIFYAYSKVFVYYVPCSPYLCALLLLTSNPSTSPLSDSN